MDDVRRVARPAPRRRRGLVAAASLAAALFVAGCDDGGQARADVGRADAPKNSAADTATAPAAPTVPVAPDLATPAPADAARPRVVIAGTSLTAGLGLDPAQAYPALLQQMADSAGLAVRIENAGLSGETSAGLARRIDWLLREPAAMVVVETGANDGLRGIGVDALAANLRRIVARVRALQPEARVYLVQMEAPPNFGPAYTRRFHDVYGEVARETGVTLVPFLLDGVGGVRSLNQADGIHPNVAGARRVAATVWRALEPALDSLDRARPDS
jgi:acyl-CoA thioesterase-1